MTSLSSNNPKAHSADGPSLDTVNAPTLSLEEMRHSIPLSNFLIEGVGRGNIEGLRVRPFADFHPVDRVELNADHCEVSYATPLRPIQDRRSVTLEEVASLTQQLLEAKRRLVADQRLYLYPGLEAFGIDPSCNRVRFRVINVRPKDRFRVSSHDQLSVEALCLLMESYCAEGWSLVRAKRAEINTLESLHKLIYKGSPLSTIWSGVKLLFVTSMLGIFMSVPLSIWGPESVSQPLREFMMPRVNLFLDQLEERRARMKPRATMKIKLHLALPLSQTPDFKRALHDSLTSALKAQIGPNAHVSPISSEDPSSWEAELSVYRGDLNELLRSLTHMTSQRLAGRRMLMPKDVTVELSFAPQVASLNLTQAQGHQTSSKPEEPTDQKAPLHPPVDPQETNDKGLGSSKSLDAQ